MKKVAKLVVIDPDNKYLLMYRDNHPAFGDDPDLPGGTMEEGETMVDTMLREIEEEAGMLMTADAVREVYFGNDYSAHDTYYSLFVTHVESRPEIVMSWEHSSYAWLDRDEFLDQAKGAVDTYMHMVYDVLK